MHCGGNLPWFYQLAVPTGWGLYKCSWELLDEKLSPGCSPGLGLQMTGALSRTVSLYLLFVKEFRTKCHLLYYMYIYFVSGSTRAQAGP